jgi:hypothetical protein
MLVCMLVTMATAHEHHFDAPNGKYISEEPIVGLHDSIQTCEGALIAYGC